MSALRSALTAGILLFAPLFSFGGDAAVLWADACARCHGEDGRGRTKPGRRLKIKDLTSPAIQQRLSERRIVETITEGKFRDDGEEQMPSFRGKLTDEEMRTLATYVKELGGSKSAPGSRE